jgi:hypothetical protein
MTPRSARAGARTRAVRENAGAHRAGDECPGLAEQLAGVEARSVTSRAALAALPVLRKSELKERQTAKPPLGGFAVTALGKLKRLLMSPGPIFEPEGHGADWWSSARALFAAGFRSGDIVHNSFAYHLTPGGFILEAGAHALGCTVIPGGIGNTEQQVEAIVHLKPSGYTGTPDFLKILLDAAEKAGKDVSSLKRGLVSGAALPSSLREHLAGRGVAVKQCYATAELGVIAYEATALEGMVVNESVIVEIVRPGTGDPVAEGEVGEVVVTSFNADYPMIRLATGDLSAVLAGRSPCGRTNMRIKGWMGRADQTTGQGHVRAPGANCRSGQAPSGAWARAAFGDAGSGAGRDDACRRVRRAPRRLGRRGGGEPAVRDQAQGPRSAGCARDIAERRKNYRRRAQYRLTGAAPTLHVRKNSTDRSARPD